MSMALTTIGWREWVALPQLGIPKLKAKIDTGARTSCLHAFSIEEYDKDGDLWVRIGIHPIQRDNTTQYYCDAKVIDKRPVTDSGGHTEERYVISTLLELAGLQRMIEITLTNRDSMRFRMLLGRTSMLKTFMVDPSLSYVHADNQQSV